MSTIGNVEQALLNELTPKFVRRKDITFEERFNIALVSLCSNACISAVARLKNVSRTFIYNLGKSLTLAGIIIFSQKQNCRNIFKLSNLYSDILALRMEGRCSIASISSLLGHFNTTTHNSQGNVSQILNHIGSLLPNTLSDNGKNKRLLTFACDEIFAGSMPILITAETKSSAILKIELCSTRKAEDWKNHWSQLAENGITAKLLVSDEGTGLTAGKALIMPNVIHQKDTYHGIAHRLGGWVNRLEIIAYGSINSEYCKKEVIQSAKSECIIAKRKASYQQAKIRTEIDINNYENFKYLYQLIIKELRLFDENGTIRKRDEAEETIRIILELIKSLKIEKINNEVKKVENSLSGLFEYFKIGKDLVKEINDSKINQDGLICLFLSWQWNKAFTKSKKNSLSHYSKKEMTFYLDMAQLYLGNDYLEIKSSVYDKLDDIVQSSAIVECINSLLRPYLNEFKNHVTQEWLNLFMFYHNHRRYLDGKRKGKIPHEILTGKDQEKHWIELVLEEVSKNNPNLFKE